VFRDTAHVYDVIYDAMGKDYERESADIHALVQARRPGASTLLDVACGTGGHLRHLRAHYEVTGTDVEPAMLQQAAERLPGVPLHEADMRTLALGRRFDAVMCLFSSIGYLRDRGELDTAVAAMANHLAPGGVLVVDGWVRPDAWRDQSPPHTLVGQADELTVVRVGRSERDGSETRLEMHYLIADAGRIEHRVEEHRMHLFTPEEYEGAFRAAGLGADVVESPMAGRDRYVGVAPA
jgi:SAM-dependent methyltransferase